MLWGRSLRAATLLVATLPAAGAPGVLRLDLRALGGRTTTENPAFLNTAAFERGVRSIRAAGGGELYVPPGEWLTTGFALTSHMRLFLESGATIRALSNFSCVGSNASQLCTITINFMQTASPTGCVVHSICSTYLYFYGNSYRHLYPSLQDLPRYAT
jgi:hypothetical protein